MREEDKGRVTYEPPRVITYSAEDLIEEIGPAKACSFGGDGMDNW